MPAPYICRGLQWELTSPNNPMETTNQTNNTASVCYANTDTANALDIVDSIYDSYTNGSFTQAREEIAEALEAGIELIEEAYRLTDPVVHNDLLKFIAIEAAKYLANRPSLEARQNVLKW